MVLSKKRKKDHNKKAKKSLQSQSPTSSSISPLNILAERRTGGPESIQGFDFQFKYATWKILTYLTSRDRSETKFIRLEGIEDLDVVCKLSMDQSHTEFIQVKYSKNEIDAYTFWEKGILQNFAEVYIIDNQSRFRVVHNMRLARGYLSSLADANEKQTKLSSSDLEYWEKKFNDFKNEDKAKNWDWTAFSLADFLSRIAFERRTESFLTDEARRLIISDYNITSGNEEQYLNALYNLAKEKSRQRQEIKHLDLMSCIEDVKEDVSKGPINPAVQGKWLVDVDFDEPVKAESSSYFEGKAAKPFHIAAGLPIRRKRWEGDILKTFQESDVIVIRASSGQGKSTLAWQAAFGLRDTGWTPYELLWCADEKQIGNIVTLIESRVKVGKVPLIIIDGLRSEVAAWGNLAQSTLGLPVKYIVTTREEDWYRFGADRSQLRLRMINIEMTKAEAEKIFQQFKDAGKIHPSIDNWQSAWEKVADRGLLIEYVYLLTQGEMIEERLSHQIRLLSDELDSKSKLEILRLVSVADLCSVRLPTSSLINSIENRMSFLGDRGQCLKSLQKEYYIQLEDREYIEGLHPVRSQHLANLLHQTLPLQDTLLHLLPLIEVNSIFDYCANAPLMIEGQQRVLLLTRLAECISKRPYNEMVYVIDGLFSTDALQHWKENQNIYDDIFARGMGIFSICAFPWSGANITDFAVGLLKTPIESISETFKKIRFNPKKFDTFIFIEALSKSLVQQEIAEDIRSLGRLALWFIRFDLDCPLFSNINKMQLCDAIQLLELEDSGELFAACYKIRPDLYRAIFNEFRFEIIGLLKKRTNTLTIREDDFDLHIEYLIEFDSDLSVNEQSVNRIDLIKPFIHPQYRRYCTQGLRPPVPHLEYYTNFDESVKHIPVERLKNSFSIHINRIWQNRISANYESPSVYDWQKQWYDIRSKSLELAIECAHIFEAKIWRVNKKLKISKNKIIKLYPDVISLLTSYAEFPTRVDKNFGSEKFEEEIKAIRAWASVWQDFLDQILRVSHQNQDNYNYLVNFNIQQTYKTLERMQNAYDSIEIATFLYFDVSQLKDQETKWYDYLSKVIAFWLSAPHKTGKTFNPKSTITQWWDQLEKNRIAGIDEVLYRFEKNSDIKCIRPTYTFEDDDSRNAAIGIKGFRWEQLDVKLETLLLGLCDLTDIDVDTYLLIILDDDHPQKPFAISLPRDYLRRVKEFTKTLEEFEENNYIKPRPIPLKEDALQSLPGISATKIKENLLPTSIGEILVYLWRITQVRKRLSQKVKTEFKWLQELIKYYKLKLENSLAKLEGNDSPELWSKYHNLIETIVNKGKPFTEESFQQMLRDDIQG
jgi:hypothetical protein